jgi:hypothetical protein
MFEPAPPVPAYHLPFGRRAPAEPTRKAEDRNSGVDAFTAELRERILAVRPLPRRPVELLLSR